MIAREDRLVASRIRLSSGCVLASKRYFRSGADDRRLHMAKGSKTVSATSNLGMLGAVTIVAVAAVAVLKAKLAGKSIGAASFKPKALLTPNEIEFLTRLEAAAPEYRFCPQVAMGALIEPAVSRQDAKAYFRARGMFSQKIVDFVAVDRATGSVVAIVELDDRTHSGEKDAKRDAMLASAGYRTVRWSSKAKPDAAAIRSALLPRDR